MAYTITQRFISKNRPGTRLNAIGTVLHETATPGASDEDEFRYFNSGAGGRKASVHAFVDYDSITQTIPWNEVAWHAGSTANKNYIGIELCNYNDAAKFNEIWERAVWLFAWVHINVIKQTTINNTTLMSHAEVSQKWRETDHTDPIGYFAKYGKTVDMFRNDVQKEINRQLGKETPAPPKEEPKKTAAVNTDTLNLQKALNRLKIRDSNGNTLAEDGSYGPLTTSAVRRFQQIMGIQVDGKAGPQTRGVINRILSKPVTKRGAKNTVVRYIQYRAGAEIDGSFGPETGRKVREWQKKNGLAQDGSVGPKTWVALIG